MAQAGQQLRRNDKGLKRFWRRKKDTLSTPQISDTDTSNKVPVIPVDVGFKRLSSERSGHSDSSSTLILRPAPLDSHEHGPIQDSPQGHSKKSNPLGLHLLYEPKSTPVADIIFVHGLNGTSHDTWSKGKKIDLFWPQMWLPEEDGINSARVFSFGYDSNIWLIGRANTLSIIDFAKQLLYAMKFGGDTGTNGYPTIGEIPVVFVAHSMGGLVVKKAFIMGQNDPEFRDIVMSIHGILFLSTPHRGSNLAEILERILAASIICPPKQYIAELKNNSRTLEDINEHFRNIAPKLTIFSFFETAQTAFGPTSDIIVGKDSSTLGYPGEVSTPLYADHRDVCKFSSQDDPNYITIRDALKHLIKLLQSKHRELGKKGCEEIRQIGDLLGITEAPTEDYDFFSEHRMIGSCEWIVKMPEFESWLHDRDSTSKILWCTGLAGTGKSVLATFIIHHLKEQNLDCTYFFFRFGDQVKRSVSACLRSLAYQVASVLPEFRRRLLNEPNVQNLDARRFWQKIFVGILFKINCERPLFVVIDALDECDESDMIFKLFAGLPTEGLSVRAVCTSRKTHPLSLEFGRLKKRQDTRHLFVEDPEGNDIRSYVTEEMSHMLCDDSFREQLSSRIFEKAQRNFLWVRLVLRVILRCQSQAAIEKAFEEIPPRLDQLYRRMDCALASWQPKDDQEMTKTVLSWIACSRRPLTLDEFARVLQPEHQPVSGLQRTISNLCGDFVTWENQKGFTMIHYTARECLTQNSDLNFYISQPEAHHHIFAKCLYVLQESCSEPRTATLKSRPFLLYAATSWPYHLELSATYQTEASFALLAQFFRGSTVLTWIYILASVSDTSVLVQASESLQKFIKSSDDAGKDALVHQLEERTYLKPWVKELKKFVGKYATHLVKHPESLFRLIPPFCPEGSIIRQQSNFTLSISGVSNPNWDECLTSFPTPPHSSTQYVRCSNDHFAFPRVSGIHVYHSATCEELHTFKTGEPNYMVFFNRNGDKLAVGGKYEVSVWNISTGEKLYSTQIWGETADMAFLRDDETIITLSHEYYIDGSEDEIILTSARQDPTRKIFATPSRLKEMVGVGPGSVLRRMVLSPDGLQLAVLFHPFHLAVWSTIEPTLRLIGTRVCNEKTKEDIPYDGRMWESSYKPRICFNPITGHILALTDNGHIFKWHPTESRVDELPSTATDITCCPTGDLFITNGEDNMLRIWDFHRFSLIYERVKQSKDSMSAVDPFNGRIYEITGDGVGGTCFIWEPDILIRRAQGDHFPTEALGPQVSTEPPKPARLVRVGMHAFCFYTCSIDGNIQFFEPDGSQIIGLKPNVSGSWHEINRVFWNDDKTIIVIIANRDLTAFKLDEASGGHNAVLGIKLEGCTFGVQIHLSPQNDVLLESSFGCLGCYSLGSKPELTRPDIPISSFTTCWVDHPLKKDLFIGFGMQVIAVGRWRDMEIVGEFPIDKTIVESPSQSAVLKSIHESVLHNSYNRYFDRVWITPDSAWVLYGLYKFDKGNKNKLPPVWNQLVFLPVIDPEGYSSPQDSSDSMPHIVPKLVPDHVLRRAYMPLGFLPPRKTEDTTRPPRPATPLPTEVTLAFIDRDRWVCTWTWCENGTEHRIKRYCFFPQDWRASCDFGNATLRDDGAILCPRGTELVVIENWLEHEFTD
ncbi:hypothetical protein AJ80_02799 [Polytolypa hystricis UAMH7299]|uniref:Uncharacterized protein n=1 Tax=Polytolypa hystricis (strain UAMH7299) TaxID=1447883 RepID=A0A2B7YQA2_POLH7|nr:hypothetical protein AJ80_02799 [Polytolypa hystricis UAMH7299]